MLGVVIPVAAALGLIAGALRHELVLTLLGAMFLAVWGYSLLAVLFLSVIHRKRAAFLAVRLPEALGAGQPGAIFCIRENTRNEAASGGAAGRGTESGFTGKGRFFRLPGILVRYVIELSTKDGRALNHIFDPDFLQNDMSPFTVPLRGAYYGERDKLLVFDVVGLFHAAIIVHQTPGPRLLVTPRAAEQVLSLSVQSGGAEQRIDPHFLRTDDLIEHRPYIPGDDPRRINWKLYGHAGDLFVREGEPEPPPHSKLLILIDTQTDSELYTAEAGRRGVDLLCENALALALDYMDRGMDVCVGYSGGAVSGGGPAELAAVLAYPAALSFSLPLPLSPVTEPAAPGELPLAEEVRGVLILALPRDRTGGGTVQASSIFTQKNTRNTHTAEQPSLDRFLKKRNSKQTVDLLFLYAGEDAGDIPDISQNKMADANKPVERLEESAEVCVRFYNGKGGVRARHIRI
jgi:hypothetical protein